MKSPTMTQSSGATPRRSAARNNASGSGLTAGSSRLSRTGGSSIPHRSAASRMESRQFRETTADIAYRFIDYLGGNECDIVEARLSTRCGAKPFTVLPKFTSTQRLCVFSRLV